MKAPKRFRADAQIDFATYENIQQKAKSKGVKPSDIIREALRLYLANETAENLPLSKKIKVLVSDYDKKLLRVKATVSNNINQMARVLNSARLSGDVNDRLAEKIQRQLNKMLDVMLHGSLKPSLIERLEQC